MSRAPRQAVWLWPVGEIRARLEKETEMSDLQAENSAEYQPINAALWQRARKLSAPLALTVFLSGFLAACLGPNIDQIVQSQCPPVNVLNTADSLPRNGVSATLSAASLTCSVNRDSDDALQAEVTLTGRVSEQMKLPIFVAALDGDNKPLARTQFAITAQGGVFSLTLPPVIYGKKGDDGKARLVAGFVLTPAQLEENRAAYRQNLGLGD